MIDCLIIGKGPAGISCAIYLKRYGFNPVVIGKDGGALEKAHLIENYYGIESISGHDFIQKGIIQAEKLGISVISDEVIDIIKEKYFIVTTTNNTYEAKTVVLATGASRNRYIKADKYEGVSYCATCDGFFYRKKKIALIGNGNYMAHELDVLTNMCKDITVFTDGLELEAELPAGINVVKDKIESISGDTHIRAINTSDNSYPVEGCFIAIGNASGFTLAKHMGIALNGNSVIVNEDFMTNIDGLYACGDAIGGLLQVSKAVSDGAICATAISKKLKIEQKA